MNKGHTIPVLNAGYVRLRDWMGDDLTVVNAARVSFAKESEWNLVGYHEESGEYKHREVLLEKDKSLIAFLAREGHWSPFAHPKVSLEVKAPLVVVDQWKQTKVDAVYTYETDAWNQVSRRYVTMEPEFYIPEVWRSAPENKKQGSGEPVYGVLQDELNYSMNATIRTALSSIQSALNEGVAPEQARLFLPAYAMYTVWRWTASLQSVGHFLSERLASDAQSEIREYAAAVESIVRPLFPESIAALLPEQDRKEGQA